MSSSHTSEHHHIQLKVESSNSCKYFPSTYWELLTKLSLLLNGSFLQNLHFELLGASCKTFPSTYWKFLTNLSLLFTNCSLQNIPSYLLEASRRTSLCNVLPSLHSIHMRHTCSLHCLSRSPHHLAGYR
jgi:hypothetical protein